GLAHPSASNGLCPPVHHGGGAGADGGQQPTPAPEGPSGMSLSRSRGWASVDDREATSRAQQPLSTALLNLLPLVLLVGAVSADRFGIRWHGINLRLELIAALV